MTRGSRHKSKRSAKDAREYSDSEEDVSKGKHRERKEGGSSRGYKESVSGSLEKRKLASQGVVVKESSGNGNGYSSEEYVSSKKRKEKSGRLGSDRWNGSGELLSFESEVREETSHFDEKALKLKGVNGLKSKVGSGNHDAEKKGEIVGSSVGKEESRSGKTVSKRREKDKSDREKLDRDLSRKDDYKEYERDTRFVDSKRDPDYHSVHTGEQKVKKGAESKDWALEEDYRKHESERERDRRRRKRTDEYDGKDKYQDRIRDSSDNNLKSRHEGDKDGRDKDEKDIDISIRDKRHRYYDRDHKGRDDELREGKDCETAQKNDHTSRNHNGNPSDSKYGRDGNDTHESRHKKSRTDSSNYNSSVMYDDQSYTYRDYKETKRSKDRYSNLSETKYRDSLCEERSCNYDKEGDSSGVSDRAHLSRATETSVQTGDNGYAADLTSERHRNSDRHASPARLAEKSSSGRRHHNRTGDRRTFDYEDAGHRNSGHKDINYKPYGGKQSQYVKVEASSRDDGSQVDGDDLPGSSSLTRSVRMSDNSRSLLPPPPPLKHGGDNSYVAGSSEDDGRGKSNNRPKRLVDANMGRMRGNAWRGVPNWPSHMTNGFMPFPHGPQTVGFHPMMQQFPQQMFGVAPSMDQSGNPYNMPDADRFPGYGRPFGWPNPADDTCPSPMPNWDPNNMASASREPSVDRKSSNSRTMEFPSGSQRAIAEPVEDHSLQSNHGLNSEPGQTNHFVDGAGNCNLSGSNVPYMSASAKEYSDRMLNGKVSSEIRKDHDSDVHRSCVYLSKIDISGHLAHSDLFDHCVSLLGIKQNALAETRASTPSKEEERVVEGGGSTTIYTCISRVPIFAGLGDSHLKKAISLYKHEREDVVAKSVSFPSNGSRPHSKIEGSDPTTSIDESMSLASSLLGELNGTEPACPKSLGELPASNNFEDKTGSSVSSPKLFDKPDEVIENDPELPRNPISTSVDVKMEVTSEYAAGAEDIDVAEGKTLFEKTTGDPEGAHEDHTLAEDDDGSRETKNEQATVDPTLSSPAKVSLNTAELHDFGSVNLTRIHQSPESTH